MIATRRRALSARDPRGPGAVMPDQCIPRSRRPSSSGYSPASLEDRSAASLVLTGPKHKLTRMLDWNVVISSAPAYD